MDERPKWTPEQLEMLEAIRSKNDTEADPALSAIAKELEEDPELAQRLERVLEWDARVSEAMSDVPVPPALAEQILQGLEAHSDRPSPAPNPPPVSRRGRRRLWMAASTCVGLAAVLIVFGMVRYRPSMEPGELRSIASERFLENQASLPQGVAVTTTSPPARFPYSPDLGNIPGTTWRHIPKFDGAEAVAYDVPLGPKQKATIYVVRCRSVTLPRRPPNRPVGLTRGIVIGAWRGDDVVYVAVVEGGPAAYRLLLRSLSGPLT